MKDRIFTIIWILLLSSAGSVASAAELDEPSGPGVAIDLYDPSGVAMSAFHAALREAENGSGQAKALFYGASHVASDTYTGRLRRLFQARFGDAGHGFVLPAKPEILPASRRGLDAPPGGRLGRKPRGAPTAGTALQGEYFLQFTK